jgi:hypothetical protein
VATPTSQCSSSSTRDAGEGFLQGGRNVMTHPTTSASGWFPMASSTTLDHVVIASNASLEVLAVDVWAVNSVWVPPAEQL